MITTKKVVFMISLSSNFYLQEKKKIKKYVEHTVKANILRNNRKKSKKTQKQIAEELKVPLTIIGSMEIGDSYSDDVYNKLLDYYGFAQDAPERNIQLQEIDYIKYHYNFLIDMLIDHITRDITTSVYMYMEKYYNDMNNIYSLLYLFGDNKIYIPDDCRRKGDYYDTINSSLDLLYDEFNPIIENILAKYPKSEKQANFEFEALLARLQKIKTIEFPILNNDELIKITDKTNNEFSDHNKDYNTGLLLKSIFEQIGGISLFCENENIGSSNIYKMISEVNRVTDELLNKISKYRHIKYDEYKRLKNNKEQDIFNTTSELIWMNMINKNVYEENNILKTNYTQINDILYSIEKTLNSGYKKQNDYNYNNYSHYTSNPIHIEPTIIFLIINNIDIEKIDIEDLISLNIKFSMIYKQIILKFKKTIDAVSKKIVEPIEIDIENGILRMEFSYQTLKKIYRNHN